MTKKGRKRRKHDPKRDSVEVKTKRRKTLSGNGDAVILKKTG